MELITGLLLAELALCYLIAVVHRWDPSTKVDGGRSDISDVLTTLRRTRNHDRASDIRALVDLQLHDLQLFTDIRDLAENKHHDARASIVTPYRPPKPSTSAQFQKTSLGR